MASILFSGSRYERGLLEEVRKELNLRLSVLNHKRRQLTKKRFAQVHLTDVLVHPATGEVSLLVSFSDRDKNAPRFTRRALVVFGENLKSITQSWRV